MIRCYVRVGILVAVTAFAIAGAIRFSVLSTVRRSQEAIGPRLAEAVGTPVKSAPAALTNEAISNAAPREGAVERDVESGPWDSPQELADWASREEQRVAALGDLHRRIPALITALGGRSSLTNAAEVIAAFAAQQRRTALVRQWAAEQIAAGGTVSPEQYPAKEIRIAAAAGDVAWQELYVMIEPLDEAAVVTRGSADKSLYRSIDRVVALWEKVVANRQEYANVRAWRQRGDSALVGNLLAAVEEWVRLSDAGLVGK